ncbi:hypothetical protein MUG78_17075 [Gordonia alkaliphila]|uniref:hypothetical protein n=1 Tax=Gordonia alkaliphila TaxID=1053547 RepID=UPI001FF1A78C|nr:hypothetical protein [Gordonia alkaliphila]MCK0441114.1 hypothetical protein [Gordonia alkaliphila]
MGIHDITDATVSTYQPGDPDYVGDIAELGIDPAKQLHAVAIGHWDPDIVLTGTRDQLVRILIDALDKLGHN